MMDPDTDDFGPGEGKRLMEIGLLPWLDSRVDKLLYKFVVRPFQGAASPYRPGGMPVPIARATHVRQEDSQNDY